jgi:hypothetical protein
MPNLNTYLFKHGVFSRITADMVILFLVFAFAEPRKGLSQETGDGETDVKESAAQSDSWWEIGNDLVLRSQEPISDGLRPRLLEDLQRPKVAALLDLSHSQRHLLQEKSRDVEVKMGDFLRHLGRPKDSGELDRLKDELKQAGEDLQAVLTERQKDALRSVQIRQSLLQAGMEGHLLQLHGKNKFDKRDTLIGLRQQYRKEMADLRDKIQNRVLSVLDERQLELFRQICDVPGKFDPLWLELTVLQLERNDENATHAEITVQPEFLASYFQNEGFVRLDLSGRLVRVGNVSPLISTALLRTANSELYGSVEVLLNGQPGILGSQQSEASERKRESLRSRSRTILDDVASGAISGQKGIQQVMLLKDEFAAWQIEHFYGELLPFQQEAFENLLFRRSITVTGLLSTVLENSDRFRLSTTQIARLERERDQALDEYFETGKRMELEAYGCLEGVFAAEDLRKWASLLKEGLLAPCPTLLLRPAEQQRYIDFNRGWPDFDQKPSR